MSTAFRLASLRPIDSLGPQLALPWPKWNANAPSYNGRNEEQEEWQAGLNLRPKLVALRRPGRELRDSKDSNKRLIGSLRILSRPSLQKPVLTHIHELPDNPWTLSMTAPL